MTNADAIRRMSDEQLDTFLAEWECGDIDYSITFCDLCKDGGNELNLDCDGCRRHWLKRDATDFGGLMYWKKNTTFETEPQLVKESTELVKDLVNAFCEDGTWLERQGVYTLTLAEAKQRAVDIIESVLTKTEPTEREGE